MYIQCLNSGKNVIASSIITPHSKLPTFSSLPLNGFINPNTIEGRTVFKMMFNQACFCQAKGRVL
jgi:DNA-binding transcriptional regulator YhcF (GntR family)